MSLFTGRPLRVPPHFRADGPRPTPQAQAAMQPACRPAGAPSTADPTVPELAAGWRSACAGDPAATIRAIRQIQRASTPEHRSRLDRIAAHLATPPL